MVCKDRNKTSPVVQDLPSYKHLESRLLSYMVKATQLFRQHSTY